MAVVYGGELSAGSKVAMALMQVKGKAWLHIADGAQASLDENRRDAHSLYFETQDMPDIRIDLYSGVVKRGEEEYPIAGVYLR